MNSIKLNIRVYVALLHESRVYLPAIEQGLDLKVIGCGRPLKVEFTREEYLYDSAVNLVSQKSAECLLKLYSGKVEIDDGAADDIFLHMGEEKIIGLGSRHILEVIECPRFLLKRGDSSIFELRRFAFVHNNEIIIKLIPINEAKPSLGEQFLNFANLTYDLTSWDKIRRFSDLVIGLTFDSQYIRIEYEFRKSLEGLERPEESLIPEWVQIIKVLVYSRWLFYIMKLGGYQAIRTKENTYMKKLHRISASLSTKKIALIQAFLQQYIVDFIDDETSGEIMSEINQFMLIETGLALEEVCRDDPTPTIPKDINSLLLIDKELIKLTYYDIQKDHKLEKRDSEEEFGGLSLGRQISSGSGLGGNRIGDLDSSDEDDFSNFNIPVGLQRQDSMNLQRSRSKRLDHNLFLSDFAKTLKVIKETYEWLFSTEFKASVKSEKYEVYATQEIKSKYWREFLGKIKRDFSELHKEKLRIRLSELVFLFSISDSQILEIFDIPSLTYVILSKLTPLSISEWISTPHTSLGSRYLSSVRASMGRVPSAREERHFTLRAEDFDEEYQKRRKREFALRKSMGGVGSGFPSYGNPYGNYGNPYGNYARLGHAKNRDTQNDFFEGREEDEFEEMPQWKNEIIKLLKESNSDWEENYATKVVLREELNSLLQLPSNCKLLNILLSTCFKVMTKGFKIYDFEGTWLWAITIQKILESGMKCLENHKMTHAFDMDSYLAEVQNKIPWDINKQRDQYFIFIHKMLPESVVESTFELKFFDRLSKNFNKQNTMILMNILLETQWVREKNLIEFLAHLLKNYELSNQTVGKRIETEIAQQLRLCMSEKELKNVINVLTFTDSNKQYLSHSFRVNWKDLFVVINKEFPCPDFYQTFILTSSKSKAGGSTIEMGMVCIKFLHAVSMIFIKEGSHYEAMREYLINMKSPYIKFLDDCDEYIDALITKNIPVTGISQLKRFFSNVSEHSNKLPSEIEFVLSLKGIQSDRKKGLEIRSNCLYLISRLEEVQTIVRNCIDRLDLLDFIREKLKRTLKAKIEPLSDLTTNTIKFNDLIESTEYKIASLFDNTLFDSYSSLNGYDKFMEVLQQKIGGNEGLSIHNYLDIYLSVYDHFKITFEQIGEQMTLESFKIYFDQSLAEEILVKKVCVSLGLKSSEIELIQFLIYGFRMVINFVDFYPALDSYEKMFKLRKKEWNKKMMPYYKEWKKNSNFNTHFVKKFCADILTSESYKTVLSRKNIVIYLDKYNELISYVKEKGVMYFESIRTEIDEADVDDFMKVTNINRFLFEAYNSNLEADLIENIAKLSDAVIEKMEECLIMVGPRIDHIKELSQRANQTNTNDFENIQVILQGSTIVFKYYNEVESFKTNIEYHKGRTVSRYNYKKFEELFKKEQILKESEIHDTADEEGDIAQNASIHARFVTYGELIIECIQTLNQLKNVGLIDEGFEVIKTTYNHKFPALFDFSADNNFMKIKVGSDLTSLESFNFILKQDYSESKEIFYEKFKDSDYINLTYFYGKRLYDLTEYLRNPIAVLPQIKDLFNEIGADFDPLRIRKPTPGDLEGMLDLKSKVSIISEFLKVDSKRRLSYDIDDPISIEKKVVYIVNHDEKTGKTIYDTFPLIHYILDTHNIQIIKGSHFLQCSADTTEEEIITFSYRSIFSKTTKASFVLNPENLSKDMFNRLRVCYESIITNIKEMRSINVMFIFGSNKSDYIESIKSSFFFIKYVRKLKMEISNKNAQAIIALTQIVHSEYAGMGKTNLVYKCKTQTNSLITLFLTGELSSDVLERRLANLERALERVETKADLHIKLDTLEELVHSNGVVDFLLYQICFLRRIQTKKGCLSLDKLDKIHIEVGNTIGLNLLKEKFTSLNLFKETQVGKFDSNNLIYNGDINSPEQRVAYYLKLIDSGEIVQKGYSTFVTPYNESEFKKIMRDNFMVGEQIKNRDSITYTQYTSWIKVCHRLFSEFDKVNELMPDVVIKNKNEMVRMEFCRLIRDFSTKLIQFSVEQAKSSQKEMYDIKKNFDQEKHRLEETWEKFENMKKWDASSQIIPLVMNGRFMVYCSNDRLFSKYPNLKLMVETKLRAIRGSDQPSMKTSDRALAFLKVYDYLFKYKDGELAARARRFPNLPENCDNEHGAEEGYVITDENNIKSALMIVKAMIGDPIVIMGESGCGKTFFSKFTSSCITKEEIRVVTLHAGVKESKLLFFLKDCIRRANELKEEGKKLWLLFDEFNTSSLQSIVTEIMQDRMCSIDDSITSIPDNFVFVACCNPYQLRVTKSDLGLIPDSAENRLSHKVYLVLESLMNYVWDFGQLTELDEKNHIYSIIDAENIFQGRLAKESNNFVKSVVYQAHKFLRRNDETSGVSLRDIKRVVSIIKWMIKYLTMMQEEFKLNQKSIVVLSTIMTINLCYALRMNGAKSPNQGSPSLIQDMYQKIYRKCIPTFVKMNQRSWTAEKILQKIQMIEEYFASELKAQNCIQSDIALNKPLRENLFTLFACYSTLTPLMICGKPGTSKTLCAQVFAQATKSEVSPKIKSLKNLPNSTEIYYGGSQTSTDVGIQRVFDRADRIIVEDTVGIAANQANDINMLRPLIIIDEIGLAELSPYNPLKILHPKLEKKDKKYAFLGVSNWALDLSKMNRVIYLARPDMSYADLEDTFVSIIGLTADRCQGLISDFVYSYLDFREWQMAYADHKNFHGSRDVYSVFKTMKNNLSNINCSEEVLVDLLKESIERNFSGAIYSMQGDDAFNKANAKMIESFPRKITGLDHQVVQLSGVKKYNDEHEFISTSLLSNIYSKYGQMTGIEGEQHVYEESSQTIKRILLNRNNALAANEYSIESFYDSKKPLDNIFSNLNDPASRFLLLFTENSVIDSMLIELIRNTYPDKEVIDWRGSRITKSKNDHETIEMLSMMKTYIQNGYIVVMKNIDELFGSLYDLFNQKYIEREGKKYCYLYYGDEKPRAQVHPDFRCIVIIEEDESIKGAKAEISQPAPFLNRFEKYRLKIVDLLDELQISRLKQVVYEGLEISAGLENRLVCLNIEMFASMIIRRENISVAGGSDFTYKSIKRRKSFNEETEYKNKIMRLTTSNYMLSTYKEQTTDQILQFQEQHPYDNILELLKEFEDKNKMRKVTCFTFSSTFELQKNINLYKQRLENEGKEFNWEIFNSDTLESVGTARRKTLIDPIHKQNILIQFTKRSHLKMLPSLKYIIDKKIGRSNEEWRKRKAISEENFVPGCLIIVHLTDENEENDLKNTSLSFWDEWDNVVIEDLTKSDYKSLERLFSKSKDSDNSFYGLAVSNDELRAAVFSKYLLKLVRRITEKTNILGFEDEMNEISMLLSNFNSFTYEFSEKLINLPFVKKTLYEIDKTSLFALCKNERRYFRYEDKLIEALPNSLDSYFIRVLISLQSDFKLASLNRMFNIIGSEGNQATGIMMRESFKIIDDSLESASTQATQPIGNMFWSQLRMQMNDVRKNPGISFPFIYKEIGNIISVMTDLLTYADTINSIAMDIKERIDDLMLVEELSVDPNQRSKYLRLWDLLKVRVSNIVAQDIDNICTNFEQIGGDQQQKIILLRELIKNIFEEYFRMSGKPLTGGSINSIFLDYFMKTISNHEIKEAILESLVFIKSYDHRVSNLNDLLRRLRFKIDINDMVVVEEDLEARRPAYEHIKQFNNSVLIRLVFDTEDKKQSSKISRMLENLESVEYLKFDKFEADHAFIEVTTKENARLLRIILGLLRLILKVKQGPDSDPDDLDPADVVKIGEIFERSKDAFKPNLYRYGKLLDYFFITIKMNISIFVNIQDQEELVNLLISFNEVVCDVFNRDLKKVQSGSKHNKEFIFELFHTIISLYASKEARSIFKNISNPLMYKYVNQTSHFLFHLFRRNISVQDAEKRILTIIEVTHSKLHKELAQILDELIIVPTLTQDHITHDDEADLGYILVKALSDRHAAYFIDMLKDGAESNDFVDGVTNLILESVDFVENLQDSLKFNHEFIKRIGLIRSYFNYSQCESFKKIRRYDEVSKKLMGIMLDVGEGNLAAAFSKPSYCFILNLMTNFSIVFKEGVVEASKARGIESLYTFIDIVNPKKVVDPILMTEKNYLVVQQICVEEYEKKKLVGKSKIVVKSMLEKIKAQKLNVTPSLLRYIIGINIVNMLLKENNESEQEIIEDNEKKSINNISADKLIEGQAKDLETGKESDKAFVISMWKNDPDLRKLGADYHSFIGVLANRDFAEINRFSSLPNYLFVLKTVLHIGVLIAAYGESYSSFIYKSNYLKWKPGKINLKLMQPFPREERYHGLLSKLYFITETRLKEGGVNIYRDIGVYECDCGFSYHVANCGMTMVKTLCPSCKKEIGGESHNMVQRAGHVHYSNLEELIARIEQLAEECKEDYDIHNLLPYNDDEYKFYDILEGKKERTTRIFMHMMDHAYMLMMPYLSGKAKNETKKAMNNFFMMNKDFREVYKKLNNIKQNDEIDYFMAHVMFDLEMLGNYLNVGYKGSITLANEMLVNVAESLESSPNLKKIVENNTDKVYSSPQGTIMKIQKRIEEYSKDVVSAEKKVFDYTQKKIDIDDLKAFFSAQYPFLLMLRNLPERDAIQEFVEQLKEPSVGKDYPFLSEVFGYDSLLSKYRDLVYVHIDFTNELNKSLGGLYTKEIARQITFEVILEKHKDTPIVEKYNAFKHSWLNIVPALKDDHGDLFNIAFMCQRNLDPDAYFDKLTNPAVLTLMDVVLIDSDTNEGIFMLGIIQTLLKWQEKLLIKARRHINRPELPKKRAQEAKRKELLSSVDLIPIITKNSFYNFQFNKENQSIFDMEKIENDLAELISDNQVILQFEKGISNCIEYYRFEGEFSEDIVIMEKVIKRINRLQLTSEMEEAIESAPLRIIEKMKMFIIALCEELFNQVIYDADQFIDDIARSAKSGLTSFDLSYFSKARLGHLSGYIEMIKMREVDKAFDKYSDVVGEKLTDAQRKSVMDFFEINKLDTAYPEVPIRAKNIIRELKVGVSECFNDSQKLEYLKMVGLFDIFSLECDEAFNVYMIDGEGSTDPIRGTQLIDFFGVMKQIIEDNL